MFRITPFCNVGGEKCRKEGPLRHRFGPGLHGIVIPPDNGKHRFNNLVGKENAQKHQNPPRPVSKGKGDVMCPHVEDKDTSVVHGR